MSAAHRSSIVALLTIASVPLAWLACGGGESKPPETPSTESSGASTSASASSDTPASSATASSASAADTSTPAAPTAEATATSAPPPPSLGSTDCGTCIDKTCSKQAAACSKVSDCQTTLDAIHGCSSGAASCIDNASAPSAAKPKKLAAAFEACAKKAVAKACKPKCP